MNKKIVLNRMLMAGGLLLIMTALFLTGYNMWDERRADAAANGILEQLSRIIEETQALSYKSDVGPDEPDTVSQDQVISDYILNPDMEMPVITIDGNEYIGVLTVPALELSLPVMSDWSYPKLKIAPNRFQGSAYTGNLILAGHNYSTHFGGLSALSAGDEVVFTDVDENRFTYIVAEIELLKKTDVERMETGDWDLTLFTCTLGGEDRVTVRCERDGSKG